MSLWKPKYFKSFSFLNISSLLTTLHSFISLSSPSFLTPYFSLKHTGIFFYLKIKTKQRNFLILTLFSLPFFHLVAQVGNFGIIYSFLFLIPTVQLIIWKFCPNPLPQYLFINSVFSFSISNTKSQNQCCPIELLMKKKVKSEINFNDVFYLIQYIKYFQHVVIMKKTSNDIFYLRNLH